MLEKEKQLIDEFINDPAFDKEALLKLKIDSVSSLDCPRMLQDFLELQYVETDLERMFAEHDWAEMIDFMNRLIQTKIEYWAKYMRRIYDDALYTFSDDELDRMYILAEQVDAVPKEELSKTSPILTTRTFLELCRAVYDATKIWQYPDDISTVFLYCENRLFCFSHERDEGILGVDWDDPKAFALRYSTCYHNEELWFGGPQMYINDESAKLGRNCYTMPEQYARWTGWIACRSRDSQKDIQRAIKMYLELRERGCPLYFDNFKKIYETQKQKRSHN